MFLSPLLFVGGSHQVERLTGVSDNPVITLAWDIRDPSQIAMLKIGTKKIALDGKGTVRISNSGARIALVIGASSVLPKTYSLEQNYPNPFNPVTTIRYDLPVDAHVVLRIYNILGQEVETLVDEIQSGGHNSIAWDGNGKASGVYFYRIEATGVKDPASRFTGIRKMLLIR